MEITLADLLILEPRLRADEGVLSAGGEQRRLDREPVSWVVTARTTAPHLPPLRGGELLLLPERALVAVGDELGALLRECAARQVSGVVAAERWPLTTYPTGDELCVLRWDGPLTPDAETEINRLLTACRGDLYRVGAELERRMTDMAAAQAGLVPLARVVSETTGLGMAVVDAQTRLLVEPLRGLPEGAAVLREPDGGEGVGSSRRELTRGAELVLIPERDEQQIVARFLIDRIAAAANAALQREEAARPRGSQRADATASLLTGGGNASEQRSRALALGLDPDAVFFVAVSDVESAATLARSMTSLGTAHPAGTSHGRRVTLVEAAPRIPSESLAGRVRELTARWEVEQEGGAPCLLALSGPAFGVASLPRAVREAEFVAAMQATGDVPRRAASFGSAGDLGAMGLLYQLRDAPELQRFISEALGALPVRDQRGTLRSTLRAFLESGGSQVDASQRLGIHRNTLSYRLRRIGELVGRDVADPAAWLPLYLAIRAADMLDVVLDEG